MSSSPSISGGAREPLPMPDKQYRFSEQAIAEMEDIASHYPERKAACLPTLWIAQREYGGFLTPNAIQEVADRLGLSFQEVEGVATFYTMYNLRPVGRHHLEVCTCLTCAVLGAYDVVHTLEHELGIGIGQTTPDKEFTLSEAECLDFCGAATVMQVGDKYFTNLTAYNVMNLIQELRSSPDYTPAKLADSIVKVQITGASETGGGSLPRKIFKDQKNSQEFMKSTPQDYYEAAQQRYAVALQMFDDVDYDQRFSMVHILCGLAVECLIRAYLLKVAKDQWDKRHDLYQLASLARFFDLVPKSQKEEFSSRFATINKRWQSSHRYSPARQIEQHLQKVGAEKHIPGNLLENSARTMLNLTGDIFKIGESKWRT